MFGLGLNKINQKFKYRPRIETQNLQNARVCRQMQNRHVDFCLVKRTLPGLEFQQAGATYSMTADQTDGLMVAGVENVVADAAAQHVHPLGHLDGHGGKLGLKFYSIYALGT